ncbi:MAG TPA: family 1 glycosylhydrolase [Stenomitos sp.]
MNHRIDSFLWGVATSGYQSEGGYNGWQQPQNNWTLSEQEGRVMPTREASGFWTRYREDFQTCRELGINAFRMGWEWARIQPSTSQTVATAPPFDEAALDAYAERVAACRQHGMEPVITLHHFTHPAWLGIDAWLSAQTVDLFVDYVRTSVTHINRRLTDDYGLAPIHWYITINEPNMLVLNTYLNEQFPSAQPNGLTFVLQAYNHLLMAHVRAYDCIHDLYETHGWERPQVSFNTYCSDLYWSEKVLWDLCRIQDQALALSDLTDYLVAQSRHWEQALRKADLPFKQDLPYRFGKVLRKAANWIGRWQFDAQPLSPLFQEIQKTERPQLFDYLALDYYDPFLAHSLRLPRFSDFEFKAKGFRAWLMSSITSKWWDWRSLPEGLYFFCKHYAQEYAPCPILIAENGMAVRRTIDNHMASPRTDRLRRSEFLHAHVAQVQRLLAENIPLAGYMHWSLTDNYEWGSFTPRFGLLGINYLQGTDRILEDHLGDRPAETYAHLIRNTVAPQPPDNIASADIASV